MWLEALCAYKFKGNLKQIIWVTQMEKKNQTTCDEERKCEGWNRNSLFLRGTTSESSTCDYSDDLQILLESGDRTTDKRSNEGCWRENGQSWGWPAQISTDQHILTSSPRIKMKLLLEKTKRQIWQAGEKKLFGYSCGTTDADTSG